MIPPTETHVLDLNAAYWGVPSSQLMETAGKGVAEYVRKQYATTIKTVLIICGQGNNGGDGFVAARYLADHYQVTVVLLGSEDDIRTDTARENYVKLQQLKVRILSGNTVKQITSAIEHSDLIVDAMFGIGLSGALREPYASVAKTIQSLQNAHVLSVDVPTGLGTSLALTPEATVTFHDVKEGMNKTTCGAIHVVDIGIPEKAQLYVGPGELQALYPRSKQTSHKGDNGTVLIIGGGPFTGAPALAGMAALRTGVDLVFIATPARSWQTIASFSPDLIVRDLHADVLTSGDMPTIRELVMKCSTVLIGPGLGTAKETMDAIIKIIEFTIAKKKALVIDADAIPALSKHRALLQNSRTVITPHKTEFKHLTGTELPDDLQQRQSLLKSWAKQLGITFLLKGPVDIISDGDRLKLNSIHNEAMTVGGTGDVLAGITSALLAKGLSPYDAARIAAFLNGAAGNQAFESLSYGMTASDVINSIPTILKKYL